MAKLAGGRMTDVLSERAYMTHELKCWPQYFDAIYRNEKNFDVRRDDRGFQKGDMVVLRRTRPDAKHEIDYDVDGKVKYSLIREIRYILTGGQFGIESGYVVLGF
jgi:ribosomal protein S17